MKSDVLVGTGNFSCYQICQHLGEANFPNYRFLSVSLLLVTQRLAVEKLCKFVDRFEYDTAERRNLSSVPEGFSFFGVISALRSRDTEP